MNGSMKYICNRNLLSNVKFRQTKKRFLLKNELLLILLTMELDNICKLTEVEHRSIYFQNSDEEKDNCIEFVDLNYPLLKKCKK